MTPNRFTTVSRTALSSVAAFLFFVLPARGEWVNIRDDSEGKAYVDKSKITTENDAKIVPVLARLNAKPKTPAGVEIGSLIIEISINCRKGTAKVSRVLAFKGPDGVGERLETGEDLETDFGVGVEMSIAGPSTIFLDVAAQTCW